ncbi:MAG: pyridoxal phosphate-dependent aminotransferase [Candidatus Omnitrophica bacterium]|nr:pyridoxal phosphate-dependent aminotransferase [Candidatus Omnitrophota bacterium]
MEKVQPSATLKITALARQLKAQGAPVVNWAAGEPDFDTPEPIKQAALAAIREGFTKYTPTTGIPELKEAIARRLKEDRGLIYEPAQIAVTCGAKHALYNLLQVLVDPGQEVLIPSPYWVSYPEMVRLAGGVPVEVRTSPQNGFQIQARELEPLITAQTAGLILNSPCNPTGTVLSRATLSAVACLMRERGKWIISDEIYSALTFDGAFTSVPSLGADVYAKTFLVDGVSKAYAMTGWRIGFMAGSAEVVEAAGRLQDHSTSNPSSISQRAALAALTQDQDFVRQMAREFAARRDRLVEGLKKIPRLSWVKPSGAFYCFVDVSQTGLASNAFCERLLKEVHVAAIPGESFGWDTHVRLSFAASQAQIEEGLARLDRFVRSL